MSTPILLDPAGLAALATELESVADTLAAIDATFASSPSAHPATDFALDDFAQSWAARRADLAAQLCRLAGFARTTADSLTQADTNLATAVQVTGG